MRKKLGKRLKEVGKGSPAESTKIPRGDYGCSRLVSENERKKK